MTTTITGATGIDNIKAATGAVLQVVTASDGAQLSTTTTSFIDTGLSVAITPSSTSSRIKVEFYFESVYFAAGSDHGCSFRILRGSTPLYTPQANHCFYTTQSAGTTYLPFNFLEIDSPSTTSAITYKIQIGLHVANSVVLNYAGKFKSTIVATEIAG